MTQQPSVQPERPADDPSAPFVRELLEENHSSWWHMWQFTRMLALGEAPQYDEGAIKEISRQSDHDLRESDMASFREQTEFFHNELGRLTASSGVTATLISLLFATLALALGQGRGLTLLWLLGAFLCVGLSIGIQIRMGMQRARVLWTSFYHPLERARIRRNKEEEYLFLFDKEWRLMAVVQFLKRSNVLVGILALLGLALLFTDIVIQAVALL